jgi:predicted RNase H-like HicB family nuclease
MISKTKTGRGETFMEYTVILEKAREPGYVATVSTLRGCVS